MPNPLRLATLPLLLLSLTGCCHHMAESRLGTPMLNDLSAWNVPTTFPFWKLTDGVLVGENDAALTGNDLNTRKEYKDFDFQTDFRYSEGADSGVHFRNPGLQVQIGISRSVGIEKTGSLFEEGTPGHYIADAQGTDKLLKPNDWNTLRFRAKDGNLKVWLNGTQVLDTSIAKYPNPAPIGLQLHAQLKMKIEFRNLTIQEL